MLAHYLRWDWTLKHISKSSQATNTSKHRVLILMLSRRPLQVMLFSIILPLGTNLELMLIWGWIMLSKCGGPLEPPKTHKLQRVGNPSQHLPQPWETQSTQAVTLRTNRNPLTGNQWMKRKKKWRMLYFKGSQQRTRMIVIVINKKSPNLKKNRFSKHQKLISLIWEEAVAISCKLVNSLHQIIIC